MDKHPVGDLMSTVMEKLREMIDVDTVVGKAITTPDGTTIIPVSKVAFGFGAGGADMSNNEKAADLSFGGGSGAGVNISPVAFLIVQGDTVKLMPVAKPAGNTIDRVVEMIPDIVDKLDSFINKQKAKKEAEDFEE